MNKILKIAHRGASGYEPENTIAAFQKAIAMGADGIEFDVHFSKDGEIVVIHDETIDRTTNGNGFVNDMYLNELKSFLIDGKHEIPTLEEVLNCTNVTILVNIELKSNFFIEKVIFLIEKFVLENGYKYDNFIISSFDWESLKTVQKLNSKIPIGVLVYENLDLAIAFAKEIHAKSIHPNFKLLKEENVKIMKQNGLQIFSWTVNEQSDIQKVKSLKIDGIISDYIDRL